MTIGATQPMRKELVRLLVIVAKAYSGQTEASLIHRLVNTTEETSSPPTHAVASRNSQKEAA